MSTAAGNASCPTVSRDLTARSGERLRLFGRTLPAGMVWANPGAGVGRDFRPLSEAFSH